MVLSICNTWSFTTGGALQSNVTNVLSILSMNFNFTCCWAQFVIFFFFFFCAHLRVACVIARKSVYAAWIYLRKCKLFVAYFVHNHAPLSMTVFCIFFFFYERCHSLSQTMWSLLHRTCFGLAWNIWCSCAFVMTVKDMSFFVYERGAFF